MSDTTFSNFIYLFIIYNIQTYLVIFFLDNIIHKINFNGKWFQLHFLVNAIIVALSFIDIKECLIKPANSLVTVENYYAGAFAVMLHLYHTIFYKLTPMDIFHHSIFVMGMIPLTLNYQKKGLSFVYFFVTGLPGGIDYLLLSLMKNNKINYITEKNINSYLNAYIRMPGGFIGSYLIFKDAFILKDCFYTNILLSGIIFYNSAYFGKMAIENNIERKYRNAYIKSDIL